MLKWYIKKERLTSHIHRLTCPWLNLEEKVPALKNQICPISVQELDLPHGHLLPVSFPFYYPKESLAHHIVEGLVFLHQSRGSNRQQNLKEVKEKKNDTACNHRSTKITRKQITPLPETLKIRSMTTCSSH